MSGFELHRAATVDEAVALLGRYGEDAAVLAGGTSVMLLARLGLLGAEQVVDIHGVGGLAGIERTAEGELRLGTLCTLRELEAAPAVRDHAPALADALHSVATVRVRNQATIGGNLAHADPAQDPPPMLLALEAHVDAVGPAGSRSVPVRELFAGFFETTLAADEVLTAVRIPPLPAQTHTGYLKFLPGTRDDYATVSVALAGSVSDGRCEWVRIALGGVAPTAVRAPAVEDALRGQPLEPDALAHAAQLVREDIDPVSDLRGSAQYKTRVAATCVQRALAQNLPMEAA